MLTLPQAAQKIGGNADYLRVAANTGRLNAVKLGRDWLVSEDELDRFARTYTPGRRGPKPGNREEISGEN